MRRRGLWTSREISSIIGRILWRRGLTLEPNCRVAPVIQILRRVSQERATLGGWDARGVSLTDDEAGLLESAWSEVLANPVQSVTGKTYRQTCVFMATDASDDYWGELFFDELGQVVSEMPHIFDANLRERVPAKGDQTGRGRAETSIFLKELFAACWSIKGYMQRHEGAFEFNIAVDNTAAAAALRHMYSSNVVACHELDRLWEKLSSRGCFHPRFLRKVGGQCVRHGVAEFLFCLDGC